MGSQEDSKRAHFLLDRSLPEKHFSRRIEQSPASEEAG